VSLKELHQVLLAEAGFSQYSPRALTQFFSFFGSQCFETDGQRVRALERTRADRLSAPEPAVPPGRLYACIRPKAHESVITHGLRAHGPRPRVILSTSREMALRIGRRRDRDPVLVEIHAVKASEAGVVFRRYGECLFLVESLDPRWMEIPPLRRKEATLQGARQGPAGARGGPARPPLGVPVSGSLQEMGGFALREPPRGGCAAGAAGREEHPKGRAGTRTPKGRDPEWKEARRNTRRR